MKVKVYKYGLLPPTMNATLVHEQMLLASRYRNTLVEIERGRRHAIREVYSTNSLVHDLEMRLEAAQDGLSAAKDVAKAERMKERKRLHSKETHGALKIARDVVKKANRALIEERRRLNENEWFQKKLDFINEKAHGLRVNSRAHCGVYWGTYQLIEDQDKQSRGMPLYDGTEPNDPRFKSFDGSGQISVQLQGGLGVEELESDTQVQVLNVVDRSGRNRYRNLLLRVASNKRAPVWASFPMFMDRPIPKGSCIKRVTIQRNRVGPKDEWTVLFTLEMPEGYIVEVCGDGAIGVDLGWRVKGDGTIRVAAWVDAKGEQGEILLGNYALNGMRKTSSLQQVRDKLFTKVFELVRTARESASTPGWFLLATSHAHAWRSKAKLVRLLHRWEHERWSGDESIFEELSKWQKEDHHLWHYESGQRVGALRHRRDVFRVAAANLARRYKCLILEDFDLTRVAHRPLVGRDKHQSELARAYRHMVAPYELRGALINAFESRGGYVWKIDPAETTMTCNVCGIVEVFNGAADIWHTCPQGHIWDQDWNAAENILDQWSDSDKPEGARKATSTEKDEGRWERARRLKREKDNRKRGARKKGDKAAE